MQPYLKTTHQGMRRNNNLVVFSQTGGPCSLKTIASTAFVFRQQNMWLPGFRQQNMWLPEIFLNLNVLPFQKVRRTPEFYWQGFCWGKELDLVLEPTDVLSAGSAVPPCGCGFLERTYA